MRNTSVEDTTLAKKRKLEDYKKECSEKDAKIALLEAQRKGLAEVVKDCIASEDAHFQALRVRDKLTDLGITEK